MSLIFFIRRQSSISVTWTPPSPPPKISGLDISPTIPKPDYVYSHIQETLTDSKLYNDQLERLAALPSLPERLSAIEQSKKALDSGFQFPQLSKGQIKDFDTEYRQFIEKLSGENRVLEGEFNLLHFKHSALQPILNEIQGLSLQNALLQLRWHQNPIGKRVYRLVKELIYHAGESGYDLNKTFIGNSIVLMELANMTALKNKGVYSENLLKKYIKGRGVYGGTPHPLCTLIKTVVQERETPFAFRQNDPLEWIRDRLRQSQKKYCSSPQQIYQQMKRSRHVKPLYC